LNAVNHGVAVTPEKKNGQRSLATAVAEYLDEIKLTKKPRSHAAYSVGLRYFEECCTKQFVENVERRDLLEFAAFLRDERELAPHSVYNKFEVVMSFLKSQGVRGLVSKNDWPRYTQEEPEIYEQEDLNALFVACNPEERHRGVSAASDLPGSAQGHYEACRVAPGEFLASQVPRHIRDSVPVGWGGSAYRATLARTL